MKQLKKSDTTFSTNRMEAFSDGVLAIIITLMILEIEIPEFEGHLSTNDLLEVIKPIIPQLIAYSLSFVMIGIYWVNHHNFFHKLNHGDRNLLWLNLNLLFWLSLVPLPTGFLGEHWYIPSASLFYAIVMFGCSVSFTWMGVYAQKVPGLFSEKIPDSIRKSNMRRNRISLGLYVASMFLAYVSVYISFVLFVVIAAMFFMPKLGMSDQYHQKEGDSKSFENTPISADKSLDSNDLKKKQNKRL